MPSTLRFSTFPRTAPPPPFTAELIEAFRSHETEVSTATNTKGLTSDLVLAALRPKLIELGFIVEGGKQATQKIKRPVFFGENALPDLQYQIDAYNANWRCGLEIEAGRAWMGNRRSKKTLRFFSARSDSEQFGVLSHTFLISHKAITNLFLSRPLPRFLRKFATSISKNGLRPAREPLQKLRRETISLQRSMKPTLTA